MKAPTLTIVSRITRPREERGVDHGSERIVLVRVTEPDGYVACELIWQRAGKYWRDIVTGYVPFPAALAIVDYHRSDGTFRQLPSEKVLHKGGRLGRKLFSTDPAAHTAIRERFGNEVAAKLLVKVDLQRETLLVQTAKED